MEGEPRGINYWPNLQKLRYIVCPTFWPSSGQYIAEAAITGVIVLSRPHRLNFKLLYPTFCAISSLEEALWKIDEIERSPVLREQILDHVKRHVHLVDFSSVPTVAGLLSRVRRYNPRCSSSCDIGALTLGHT